MKAFISFAGLSFGLWISLLCEQGNPQTQLRIREGFSATFNVASESTTKRGGTEMRVKADVDYKIELAEQTKEGLTLRLAVLQARGSLESSGLQWSFDSSKDRDKTDANSVFLRRVIESSVAVTVTEGKVHTIVGLPVPGNPSNFFGPAALLNSKSLRGDLDLILSRALHGKSLLEGESYSLETEGRREPTRIVYTYSGKRKVKGSTCGVFSVRVEQARPEDKAVVAEFRSKGEAIVSLDDRILRKFEIVTESKSGPEELPIVYRAKRTILDTTKEGKGG